MILRLTLISTLLMTYLPGTSFLASIENIGEKFEVPNVDIADSNDEERGHSKASNALWSSFHAPVPFALSKSEN
jgi:hypothetical protein